MTKDIQQENKDISFIKGRGKFFHTLGNKTRLEIIHALHKKPMNVTELTEKLPYKQSTISHNLKRLVSCHFVEVKRDGLYRYYSLNKETIEPLLKIMDKHVDKYCSKLCNDE
ncbi:MAG: ArsR/SmtB family transcription factor [Candidatus Paceibacteria bacterium]